MNKFWGTATAILLGLTLVTACSNQHEPPPQTIDSAPKIDGTEEAAAPSTAPHADLYNHLLEDSLITWQQVMDSLINLDNQINSFLAVPSQQSLEETLTALEQAHTHYAATRFYAHLGIPPLNILSASEKDELHTLEVRVDQHPLILGYLDSVEGYPHSGIIHSEMPINEDTLVNEHQLGDLAYVTIGFHAIKAIIEGDPKLNPDPQKRFSKEGEKKYAPIKRRREYLALISQILRSDLSAEAQAWINQSGLYGQYMESMSQQERSARIRQAIRMEREELSQLSSQIDGHVKADVMALRSNRLELFTPVL